MTKLGRAKEGEQPLRRAIEIARSQSPKSPVFLVEVEMGLSQCLFAQNRLPEAEAVALEACSDARQNFAGDNSVRKNAANNLIQIYEKQGKHEAAQSVKLP